MHNSLSGLVAAIFAIAAYPAMAQDSATSGERQQALASAPSASNAATSDPAAKPNPEPTIDSDDDGKMDAWDRNGDGKPDVWDSDGDGRPDAYDMDGDGTPETFDRDGDGKPDNAAPPTTP